jgi:hypothetical protein
MRPEASSANLRCMPERRLSLLLELDQTLDSLSGRIVDAAGGAIEFTGWLGLVAALDALLEDGPGVEPASDSSGTTPLL